MKVFFAGIIQGSCQGKNIYSQDYRDKIKSVLREKYPDLEIIDPLDDHNNSIDYNDEQARKTFFAHLELINSSDLMIAYLPQASMGTAVEMRQAEQNNVPVLTISPMTTNWVIRLLAIKNFETIEDFEKFIHKNDLLEFVESVKKQTVKIEESG